MKRKKCRALWGMLAAGCFSLALGIAGGLDCKTVELLPGSLGMAGSTVLFGLFAKLAEAIK